MDARRDYFCHVMFVDTRIIGHEPQGIERCFCPQPREAVGQAELMEVPGSFGEHVFVDARVYRVNAVYVTLAHWRFGFEAAGQIDERYRRQMCVDLDRLVAHPDPGPRS